MAPSLTAPQTPPLPPPKLPLPRQEMQDQINILPPGMTEASGLDNVNHPEEVLEEFDGPVCEVTANPGEGLQGDVRDEVAV